LAFLSPHHRPVAFSATGSPSRVATATGLGFTFGSGNYFSAPAGTLIDSNGTGNDPRVNFRFSVSFVITSNAAASCIASIGTTATDAGAQVFVQNNSGSLRVLVAGLVYHTFGAVEVGKLYTVDVTYTDLTPYRWTTRVNGLVVSTTDANNNVLDSQLIYVGTGFGGQTVNAVILQSTLEQGAHVDLSDVWARKVGANPWLIYQPRQIIIPLAAAAGYTHPTLSNARMGSLTSSSGIPLVDYTF
jgi:TctA family transporter